MPREFLIGDWVRWSQLNGIQCFGVVIGSASWDAVEDCLVVRYFWEPHADPPRRGYALVEIERATKIPPMLGWKRAEYF